MILYFQVEEVAVTNTPAFGPDPADPNNTVYLGRNIERLTLSVIPDPAVGRGGKGSMMIQIGGDYLGTFKPGQRVKAELTVEG